METIFMQQILNIKGDNFGKDLELRAKFKESSLLLLYDDVLNVSRTGIKVVYKPVFIPQKQEEDIQFENLIFKFKEFVHQQNGSQTQIYPPLAELKDNIKPENESENV